MNENYWCSNTLLSVLMIFFSEIFIQCKFFCPVATLIFLFSQNTSFFSKTFSCPSLETSLWNWWTADPNASPVHYHLYLPTDMCVFLSRWNCCTDAGVDCGLAGLGCIIILPQWLSGRDFILLSPFHLLDGGKKSSRTQRLGKLLAWNIVDNGHPFRL